MAQLLNTLAFWRRWKEERIRLEHLEERRKEEERLRARLAEERRKEKERLLECLREHFERDFLTAYDFYRTHCTNHISLEEYNSEKINYVQSWAEGVLEPTPDPEQVAAIGYIEGHVQVVARAGSGKTATLVNRALFLQQHCRVDTDELLLLAFNKKAAEEMKERIGTLPHVMTFHALAYALVQPKNILIDEPDGGQSQSRALQDVVNQYLSDSDYADQIRDLMVEHSVMTGNAMRIGNVPFRKDMAPRPQQYFAIVVH